MNTIKSVSLIMMLIWVTPLWASDTSGLNDGEIIGIYNQVNSFDIETALLALTNSHSKKVKKLAKMVSTDHRGVRFAAAELAEGIDAELLVPSLRQAAAKQHYSKMIKLSELKGKEFDSAYLLHEIEFHTVAIEVVKNILLPATTSDDLRQHFEVVLPHFEHHLKSSIDVAKNLGYYHE